MEKIYSSTIPKYSGEPICQFKFETIDRIQYIGAKYFAQVSIFHIPIKHNAMPRTCGSLIDSILLLPFTIFLTYNFPPTSYEYCKGATNIQYLVMFIKTSSNIFIFVFLRLFLSKTSTDFYKAEFLIMQLSQISKRLP